jgi:SAM-dependent methyltransferase
MQRYSLDWVKDFYDQGCLWWGGSEADEESWYEDRAAAVERLCGPNKRVLDLGPGAAGISGRMADRGHTVVGVEISPVRVRYAQEQVNRPRAR